MNAALTTDLLVFAEERQTVQDRHEKALLGSARYALRRYGQRGWYNALVERASGLLRRQYHADTGRWTSPALREAQTDFRKSIIDSLEKTKQPTSKESLESSARTIAASIATDATNLAAELAANDDDEPNENMVKTWVSMEDERVRPTHAAAHGQTVALGEKFTVGGSKMDRPGDITAPIGEWANCRCLLAITIEQDALAASVPQVRGSDAAPLVAAADNTGVVMAEDETRVDDEQATPLPDPDLPEVPDEPLDFADDPVPFWGVIAPEDVESGDARKFGKGALRARPFPLPYAWQKVNEPGHDGSVRVGNIEAAWRINDLVFYKGHFLTSVPESGEAIAVMAESGGRMGVSVDADDGEAEMFTRDGKSVMDMLAEMEPGEELELDMDNLVTVFTTARVAGATLCNIPAFHEAFGALGEPPEEFSEGKGEALAVEARPISAGAMAVAFAPGTEDGPGWLTHPIDTDRLRDYWTKGKGAALIGWGAPGDFNRCRMHLAKYVKPQHLSGYCANRHKDALGFWPGEHSGTTEALAAAATPQEGTMSPAITLVASADLMKPPPDWFMDPQLTGPSPVVVTEEGRVFGHLATWGTCHIGIDGVCTEAPHNTSNYAYFRTGAVLTEDGEMTPTGAITMDTGHADLGLRARPAMAHYDNTGFATADVAAGEDEFGIWVAGCVRPDTPPEKIRALRGAVLSGDWRDIAGDLELVAALAVNVGGFPVPRIGIAASGGRQTALVAAGMVLTAAGEQVSESTVEEIVTRTLDKIEASRAAKARMATLAAARAAAEKAKMDAIAARVGRN